MKFNLAVFKKGKALYWVLGAIAIFVVFYLLASKGAGSSGSSSGGGITTVNAGPSDAAIAASAAVSQANIMASAQANETNANLAAVQSQTAAQVAIATLQYQGDLAGTQASADVAKYLANLDASVQSQALSAQTEQIQTQAEYSFATAKMAAETNLQQINLNAQIVSKQLDTNAKMFEAQVKGLTQQALIGQIGNVKANDRDNAFALAAASLGTGAVSYVDRSSGSFNFTPA